MDEQTAREFRDVLRSLVADRVHFCVMGSFGFVMHEVNLGDYVVHDVDVLIEGSWANIRRCVNTLSRLSFDVRIWEEKLPSPLTAAYLEGKYYLRGRKGDLMIDCTYEFSRMPAGDVINQAAIINGIPVTQLRTLKEMRRLRGRPQDLEFLRRIEAAYAT